jgi:uncharacterized protein involved in exopolysaccharide biosynthesis
MYELSLILASIRRRRRLAVALFLFFVVAGAGAVMLLPRTYSTTSQVLIKRPDTTLQATTYPQIDALLAWRRDTAIETYVALARQPAIAATVIRQLDLKTTARELLDRNVTVTPLTTASGADSDIMSISVDWHNAADSASIANAFVNSFIAQQRVLAASQASEAAASLSRALSKAQGDLSAANRALTLFESRHELADASTQTTSLLSSITEVQSKIRTIEADRMQAQGQLSSLGTVLSTAARTVDANTLIGSSPVADQIQEQLAQQRVQLRLLRQQFTDKYPDVVATEKAIASLEAALKTVPSTKLTSRSEEPNPLKAGLTTQATNLQAQIAGDSAQLGLLRSQEASLLSQLRFYPEDIAELSDLQRQAKAAESIYDALQSNYFNAVVAKSMAVSDLTVLQAADPAFASARPPRLPALLTVVVVAFFAAVAIVALLDWYAVGAVHLSEAR